jgi:hypothetical protein
MLVISAASTIHPQVEIEPEFRDPRHEGSIADSLSRERSVVGAPATGRGGADRPYMRASGHNGHIRGAASLTSFMGFLPGAHRSWPPREIEIEKRRVLLVGSGLFR